MQVVATQLTHSPPRRTPDAEGAVFGGHVLDGDDVAGHGGDGGAAIGEAGAGVAGAAGGLDAEAGDGVAAGGDFVAGAAGLGDEDDGVAGGFGLDDVAGGGGADFLVAGEEDGDGEFSLDASGGELAEGLEGDEVAAFHVVDAGAVALGAFALPGEGGDRADGVDGVHVAHDEDAGAAGLRVGEGGADTVAETHAAGDAVDAGAHEGEVAGGEIHHAVDGWFYKCGAFAFYPRAEGGEHLFGVEGEGGGVHFRPHDQERGASSQVKRPETISLSADGWGEHQAAFVPEAVEAAGDAGGADVGVPDVGVAADLLDDLVGEAGVDADGGAEVALEAQDAAGFGVLGRGEGVDVGAGDAGLLGGDGGEDGPADDVEPDGVVGADEGAEGLHGDVVGEEGVGGFVAAGGHAEGGEGGGVLRPGVAAACGEGADELGRTLDDDGLEAAAVEAEVFLEVDLVGGARGGADGGAVHFGGFGDAEGGVGEDAHAAEVVHGGEAEAEDGLAAHGPGGALEEDVDFAGLQGGEAVHRGECAELDAGGIAEDGGGNGAAEVRIEAAEDALGVGHGVGGAVAADATDEVAAGLDGGEEAFGAGGGLREDDGQEAGEKACGGGGRRRTWAHRDVSYFGVGIGGVDRAMCNPFCGQSPSGPRRRIFLLERDPVSIYLYLR